MKWAPLSLTLRQLQYAVALSETLSFRQAAELCRVSQPSLSAQLALLEGALGVRLFERDRRRVLPTQAGVEILERARRLLLEAEDLLALAERSGDPLAGALRIGVIPTISPYLLPSAAPALRQAFPKLRTRWVEEKTELLVRSLESGALDAAVVALEAELGEVDHEVILSDPFVLAAAPDHPLGARSGPVERGELREAAVLLLDDGHCFREQALEYCSRARAHELEFRATSLATLAQMVAGGAGVTLLPSLAVSTEAVRAGLEIRPFADPAPSRTVALIWRKRSAIPDALRRIAQVLRASAPKVQAKLPKGGVKRKGGARGSS